MSDLSIHPGRAIYGKNYNPKIRRDGEKITQPANDPSKGKLAKRRTSLENRRQAYSLTIQSLRAGQEKSFRRPGSMTK